MRRVIAMVWSRSSLGKGGEGAKGEDLGMWEGECNSLGEWINEFERESLNRRSPSVLESQLVKNVLEARDSPCINPLT